MMQLFTVRIYVAMYLSLQIPYDCMNNDTMPGEIPIQLTS